MNTAFRRLAFLTGILIVLALAVALWPRHSNESVSPKPAIAVATPPHAEPVGAPETPPPPTPTPRPERSPLPPEEIVGIGAVLRSDNRTGTVRIVNVLPDSPAFQAGLTAGLIIKKVDDSDTAGMRLSECVNLLRGPIGSKVRVEVVDPEAESTNVVELIRQRVKVQM
jgi:membrane-associated protease RseP (regulator of RpoE activity)